MFRFEIKTVNFSSTDFITWFNQYLDNVHFEEITVDNLIELFKSNFGQNSVAIMDQNDIINKSKEIGWIKSSLYEYTIVLPIYHNCFIFELCDPYMMINKNINKKEETFKMNKEQLFDMFRAFFPEWAKYVIKYKKIASRTLAIWFKYKGVECSRVFLYIDQDNWQFGTKLWRKRPERLEKKANIKQESLEGEE